MPQKPPWFASLSECDNFETISAASFNKLGRYIWSWICHCSNHPEQRQANKEIPGQNYDGKEIKHSKQRIPIKMNCKK